MKEKKISVAKIEKGSLDLKISDEVIEKIVYSEALGIEGIVRVGGMPHKDAFNLFRKGRRPRGIIVEIGEDEVAVDMAISVKYNVNIPTLAEEIRKRITQAVNKITGYEVRAIKISVDGIQIGEKPKTEKKEEKKVKK
jgi:uncharacterized alkaline shock family protein YloU